MMYKRFKNFSRESIINRDINNIDITYEFINFVYYIDLTISAIE
jgi:hypothetical protein